MEDGTKVRIQSRILAEAVAEVAEPDDLLVFVHGDTIPIRPWDQRVIKLVDRHRLAGVRRDEHVGEPIPHPCFTATTVGFWHEVGGNWWPGEPWTTSTGMSRDDLGSVLLKKLDDRSVDWYPLLRTNSHGMHPLWFGVYGGLIYHHGASFRRRLTWIDADNCRWPRRTPMRWVAMRRVRKRSEENGRRVFEQLRRDPDFYHDLDDPPAR